jgi:hypothetical protein
MEGNEKERVKKPKSESDALLIISFAAGLEAVPTHLLFESFRSVLYCEFSFSTPSSPGNSCFSQREAIHSGTRVISGLFEHDDGVSPSFRYLSRKQLCTQHVLLWHKSVATLIRY